jgi:LPS-assembly protein
MISFSKLLNSVGYVSLLMGIWGLMPSVAMAAVATDVTTPLKAEQAGIAESIPVDPNQVDFIADKVFYDEVNQVITAEGQVEIAQNGRIVKADKVVYELQKEVVEASGQVVLVDQNGDTHFAERVQLQHQLKDGYIKQLRSILVDGSRIMAREGQKIGGRTVMKEASYTPCEECKIDPNKPVLWQIIADEVTHDKDSQSIEYKNAKFEVYGVPIAYTPYFSHSDGTIKQKSGFLMPRLSLNSQLGFGVTSQYYLGLNPAEDATIGARVFSKEAPVLLGGYRKRFSSAEIEFDSSATYSDSRTEDGNEFRGHLFGEGLWDIDENWRAGMDIQLVSDETYLREYDFTRDNVLENEFYIERFDNRDYFVAKTLAFQDVRVSDRSVDQPNILPEIEASFIGDPNALAGGRWDIDLSSLNIMRDGSGQDIFRNSIEAGWERRDVTSYGLVNNLNLRARGDSYIIADRDETSIIGGQGDATAFRFYPVLHNVTSYPMVQNTGDWQILIEPTMSMTVSTDSKNDSRIPNEDSQDVQIDTTNIFSANRFPGFDRVEDKTHVSYGLRTGLYDGEGNRGEVFLGQSYRLNDDDNLFPAGSGLSEKESDIVGQILIDYLNRYSLNYRFQLASDSLQSERHEIDSHLVLGDLSLATTYLYARRLERTDLIDSRQQVFLSAQYNMTDEWSVLSATRYDLSRETEGIRYAGLGLNYIGQCFSILTNLRRNYADKETGDNATEISIQIGLKNIGTFGTEQ